MNVGGSNRQIADHFVHSINYEAKLLSIQLSIHHHDANGLYLKIQLINFEIRVRPSHQVTNFLCKQGVGVKNCLICI